MTKTVTLLIDGDIVAFSAVSAAQMDIEWSPDCWSNYVDMKSAKEKFLVGIERLVDAATFAIKGKVKIKPILCITGPDNWRCGILPTYKGHRKRKPPGYREFQNWVLEESGFETYLRPGLEADDCLGILQTRALRKGEEVMMWSADKDLMQIEGKHLVFDLKNHSSKPTIVEVSELDGELLHVKQTLTGDVTDNYKGLAGYGDVKAKKLIAKFDGKPLSDLWGAVQEAYEASGQTREDMLVQARVARILRVDDYDFKKKEVILWTPKEDQA